MNEYSVAMGHSDSFSISSKVGASDNDIDYTSLRRTLILQDLDASREGGSRKQIGKVSDNVTEGVIHGTACKYPENINKNISHGTTIPTSQVYISRTANHANSDRQQKIAHIKNLLNSISK